MKPQPWWRSSLALACVAFLIGTGFSAFIALKTKESIHLTETSRFDIAAEQITLLLKNRLEKNVQFLVSTAAMFESSEHISREEFSHFIDNHHLAQQFPAIQGIGFGPWIEPEQREEFETQVQQEGFPSFRLFPPALSPRPSLPVYYLEPFTPHNQKAFGYDMMRESKRREAIMQAKKSESPAMTSKIEFVQDSPQEERIGFIFYVPVYHTTTAHGFVFAAIKTKTLFDGVLGRRFIPIDFELYDGEAQKSSNLLYNSNEAMMSPRMEHLQSLSLYGHTWTIRFKANRVLDLGVSRFLPLIEALFGTLLSLAISAWIYMLLRTQKRAQSIAEKMTRTIKEQMRLLDANVITSETDINGNITAVSQAFCDISGYTKEELLGNDHTIVRHPDMPSSLYEELWKNIKAGKPWKGEIKNQRKDGSYYWVDALITPKYNEEGDVIGYTSLRQDITDKKRIEELSVTDRLTGLYNRLKLDELFEAFLHGSERHGTPLSIIILDIDKFKSVNDTYGHQVGDSVLQEFATLLKANLRTEDIVGRWGGEEFLILAPGSDLDAAVNLAEKLREKVEAFSFHVVGQKTSSFGVSTYHWGDDEKSMVSRADEALYTAKESGRNRVEHEMLQAAAMTIAKQ